MNTKLLGATLAAVFAISAIGFVAAAETWQGIDSDSVVAKNKNTTLLTIDATDTVPERTSELAGFAWFYLNGPNTAMTMDQHFVDVDADPKNEVRDSTQNPDGWHLHNVNLTDPAGLADFCIAAIVDAPNGGILLTDDLIEVNVRNSILTGTLGETTAAFSIIVEGECGVTAGTEATEAGPLRLGVVVHDIDL